MAFDVGYFGFLTTLDFSCFRDTIDNIMEGILISEVFKTFSFYTMSQKSKLTPSCPYLCQILADFSKQGHQRVAVDPETLDDIGVADILR